MLRKKTACIGVNLRLNKSLDKILHRFILSQLSFLLYEETTRHWIKSIIAFPWNNLESSNKLHWDTCRWWISFVVTDLQPAGPPVWWHRTICLPAERGTASWLALRAPGTELSHSTSPSSAGDPGDETPSPVQSRKSSGCLKFQKVKNNFHLPVVFGLVFYWQSTVGAS